MAVNAKIVITFNNPLILLDAISFDLRNLSSGSIVSTTLETWAAGRIANYLVKVMAVLPADEAVAYMKSFQIDYNGSFLYTVTVVSNVVTIELNSVLYDIENFVSSTVDATAVITPNTSYSNFKITTNLYTEATDECNFFKVTLSTNENIRKYILDGIETLMDAPSLIIDYPRGKDFSIILENVTGHQIYFPYGYGVTLPPAAVDIKYVMFDILAVDNITVNIATSLTGATLNVVVTNIWLLTLEYSLDDITYQSSNIFTGQGDGAGIMYVKDQFNCIKQKAYTVDGLGTRQPFFSISKANAIPFVQNEHIDNCTIFKTDENTLAMNSMVKVPYCPEVLFNTCDPTKIQYKSNYSNTIVTLRKDGENDFNVVPAKLTENLNRFEKLDCFYYANSNGNLGVYFVSGDVYDIGNNIIGTYTLNGNLPDFAKVGNLVDLNGFGVLEIKDVFLDSTINKKIMLFDVPYTGIIVSTKIFSVYDLLPFEVYEFSIDWSAQGVGLYDILIESQDGTNPTRYDISENINIEVEHEDTAGITYYNDNNRDVFYKFGIKHFLRIPFADITGGFREDVEINITDDSSNSIKSVLNESDLFMIEGLVKSRFRTVCIALSCENLFINNIGYLKDNNLSTEKIEFTNIYKIEADLIKSGYTYTTNENGYSGSDEIGEELYIPALLTGDNDFIKI